MLKSATNKPQLAASKTKSTRFPCKTNPNMRSKQFFACVDGAYIKNGKILLLKRSVEPFKGCWHLVGGHVEENETLKEALKREFKEETNLDVEIGDMINGRVEETFNRIKIIVAFEITSAKGEINLSSENEAYGWFAKIPSNSVYNYAQYLIKKPITANAPKIKQ